MKNIVFVILLIMFLPFASQAKSKSQFPDLRKFQTQLELTSEQMSKLNTLYTNFDARKKLQAPAETKKEQLIQKMELNKEMRRELMKVLTPQQRREYFQLIRPKKVQQNK